MRNFTLLAYLAACVPAAFGAGATLHLPAEAGMNKTEIVFSYGGDAVECPAPGWSGKRLTAGTGMENTISVLFMAGFCSRCRVAPAPNAAGTHAARYARQGENSS